MTQRAGQQAVCHVGDAAGGSVTVSENYRPGHLLLADGAILVEPQHTAAGRYAGSISSFSVNAPRIASQSDTAAETSVREVLQLAGFFCLSWTAPVGIGGSGSGSARRGRLPLNWILKLFRAIILLPNLMSDQQHLRATGVMIIKDQPIEEGFNLFPMLLRLFPDRFYSAPLHTAPEPDTEHHRSALYWVARRSSQTSWSAAR